MKTFSFLKLAFIAISIMLFAGKSNSQTTPAIIIDGQPVQASNINNFPYWLKAGQTLEVGNKVVYISVLQYNIAAAAGGNDLIFDSVVKVTTQRTVPANKAWKVESAALDLTAAIFGGDNLGNHVATTDLNMSGYKVTNMADATASNDAVNSATLQNGNLVYAVDNGSSNAYSVTLSPAPAAYSAGMIVNFKAANANTTGASTLDVNGLGTKTIKKQVNSDLVGNDIKAGQCVSVIYDGTNFQMISPVANSAGIGADNVFAATSWQSSNTSSNWENISTISYTVPQDGLYHVLCSYESQDGSGGTDQHQRLLFGSVIGDQDQVGPNQSGYQFRTIDNLITLTASTVIYLQNQNDWNYCCKNTVKNIQFSVVKMN